MGIQNRLVRIDFENWKFGKTETDWMMISKPHEVYYVWRNPAIRMQYLEMNVRSHLFSQTTKSPEKQQQQQQQQQQQPSPSTPRVSGKTCTTNRSSASTSVPTKFNATRFAVTEGPDVATKPDYENIHCTPPSARSSSIYFWHISEQAREPRRGWFEASQNRFRRPHGTDGRHECPVQQSGGNPEHCPKNPAWVFCSNLGIPECNAAVYCVRLCNVLNVMLDLIDTENFPKIHRVFLLPELASGSVCHSFCQTLSRGIFPMVWNRNQWLVSGWWENGRSTTLRSMGKSWRTREFWSSGARFWRNPDAPASATTAARPPPRNFSSRTWASRWPWPPTTTPTSDSQQDNLDAMWTPCLSRCPAAESMRQWHNGGSSRRGNTSKGVTATEEVSEKELPFFSDGTLLSVINSRCVFMENQPGDESPSLQP